LDVLMPSSFNLNRPRQSATKAYANVVSFSLSLLQGQDDVKEHGNPGIWGIEARKGLHPKRICGYDFQ